MSLLTTIPAELLAAATQLEGIATSLEAQNVGAAAPTTAIAPAAADPVSALQAAIYSAYGTVYQQIAAEVHTVQQQFVSTLGLSSGTYTATEAANAQSADPFSGIENIFSNINILFGGTGNFSNYNNPFVLSGNTANLISFESGNWASAMSDCLGMAGGGLIPADGPLGLGNLAGTAGDAGAAAAGAADAVNATAPMGGGFGGALPVAGLSQATMVSSTLAAPSWASPVTPIMGTNAALPVQTVGWTSAVPQTGAPVAAMPGMPGAGAAARGSALGAPRYGVKPIVMPKAVAV